MPNLINLGFPLGKFKIYPKALLFEMQIPKNVYRRRVKKVQSLMQENDVDALLVLSLENYRYFTGDVRKQPRMLIPSEGDPAPIVFEEEKEEVEKKTGLEAKSYRSLPQMLSSVIGFLNALEKDTPVVAVEMEFSTPAFLIERFRMANPHVEVVDAKQIVAPLRKIKDRYELELMKRAGKLADYAIEVAVDLLKPGITENELALEVEYCVRKKGAERLSFPMFVNSGKRSLWLHGMATDKRIEEGDVVLIDVGPVYNGYCADIARTFVVGKAGEEQRKAYRAYLEMQERAVELIERRKNEITVLEIERSNDEFLKSYGYGGLYVRGFVHGIGLGFEEIPFPTIFPEDLRERLVEGMTLAAGHSVLSIKKVGGFRIEDTYYLGKKVESFTGFDKDMLEVG